MSGEQIASAVSFLWQGFWRASWQASALALVVVLLQMLFRSRLSAHGRYALWSIVLLRLLLPVLPQTRFSAYRLLEWSPTPPLAVSRAPDTFPLAKPQAAETQRANQSPAAKSIGGLRAARSISATELIAIAWLTGSALLTVRIMLACRKLRRNMRILAPADDPSLLSIARGCADAMRLRRCPPLLMGESVRTPAVVGLIWPKIILPAKIARECDSHEIRLIVLHEMAHLKRQDLIANWLIAAATLLHWFNPIVWLAAARMRADRELACDEMVLSRCDARQARDYGRTLVKLIEILSPPPARAAQLVGILEQATPMQRRIRMIANYDPRRCGRWTWTGPLLLLLGCAALTDSARGDGKQNSPPPTTKPAFVEMPMLVTGAPPQSDAELREQLRQVISEIRFEAIPLSETVEFIRAQNAPNVVVNWRALEAAGIDRNAPITLRLQRVTIEQALRHILNDAGGGTVKLDYAIRDGAIVISTEEDLSGNVTTVFYDVHDLMTSPEGQPLTGSEAQKKLEDLRHVIVNTIAPDSWRENGGTVGGVEVFNGKLIVQQTPANQQLVDQTLTRLREKPTTQPRPLSP